MIRGERVHVCSAEILAEIAAANRLSRRWVNRVGMRTDDEVLRQSVQDLIAQAILVAGELHRGERCDRQTVRRALVEMIEQGLDPTTGTWESGSGPRSNAVGCISCGGMVVMLAIACLKETVAD